MSLEFRRKDQRGLTTFTARELFLDYHECLLEPGARAEFDKLLANEVGLRLDFEKFQDAIQYCQKVSSFELSSDSFNEITSAPTPLESIAKRLNVHRLPVGLRWGAEALLVVSVLFIAVLIIPWGKIIRISDREQIVLAEIEHGKSLGDAPEAALATGIAVDPPNFVDEGALEKAEATPSAKIALATPTPVPIAQPPPKPVATPTKIERPIVGSLYRGAVDVTNLDATTLKFIEQISSSGGRKAGEVELGWEKGKTRYFHFTIPGAKYEEFLGFANQYGSVQINREPHPRMMPEGIVRVILVLREQGDSP